MAHYLDTSAIVKLVVAEPESAALLRWLSSDHLRLTSSDPARAELLRAVRHVDPGLITATHEVLEALEIQTLNADLYERAGRLDPLALGTLDALHLACALNLDEDLESIVTYDERLADAARQWSSCDSPGMIAARPGDLLSPGSSSTTLGPWRSFLRRNSATARALWNP